MKTLVLLATAIAPGSDDGLIAKLAALSSGSDPAAPGAVVCVVRDGQLVASHAVGVASVESGEAITTSTPFYIASLAKPFTAATVVLAAAQGKVELDVPVRELFPELPESYAPATIRHLLHHASGIPDVYDTAIGADLGRAALRDNASAIELLTRLPRLSFAPGERFLYSNSGYVLLAESLERTTKKGLATWARKTIFEPAGMKTARFLGGEGPDVAISYRADGRGWSAQEIATGMHGPGGMIASAEDLVAFELAWQSGKIGDATLRASLVEARYSPHAVLGPYGAGWMRQRHGGLRVERHFGGSFGYSSDFRRFPGHGVTIIALSNNGQLDASDLAERVANIVLADEIAAAESREPVAVQLEAEERARFGMMWREVETGRVWVVTPNADGFDLVTLGDLKLSMVPVSSTRLEALDGNAPIAVEVRGDGLVVLEGVRETVLEAIAFPPTDLPPREDFTGAYTNEALGARIDFIDGPRGSIVLDQKRPMISIAPFMALAADVYVCSTGAQVDFHRNEDGDVVGLTMNANRSWGIEFVRD